MKLDQHPWSVWGFIGNPFDNRALSMTSKLLPISKAFVGRHMDAPESMRLVQTIRNPGGGSVVLEGDIGVGKTTLVNYHRYLWENEAEDRLLTPVREIAVYGRWQAKDFLMDILGHLSHKMLTIWQQKSKKPSNLLKKLQLLHQIFYHESLEIEASVCGFGLGYGTQQHVNVPHLSESQLINYLVELVEEIRKLGYKGVLLHFDNLELLTRQDIQECQNLFEEIRDILQLPDVYYVFVARTGFFSQIIGPLERVRSIMGWPITIPPLTCADVIEAINTRYRLLEIKSGSAVPPVSDSFVQKLYQMYGGKIRFIMDSITQISLYQANKQARTLHESEAKEILYNLVKAKTSSLSHREHQALRVAIECDEFNNEDMARILQMKAPNVSKLLQRLSQENLIYYSRREGRNVYYQAMDEMKILSKFPEPARERKKQIAIPLSLTSLNKKARLEKLSSYLLTHDTISSRDYQDLVGVSANTARLDIGEFIENGMLRKQGEKKGTIYVRCNMVPSLPV